MSNFINNIRFSKRLELLIQNVAEIKLKSIEEVKSYLDEANELQKSIMDSNNVNTIRLLEYRHIIVNIRGNLNDLYEDIVSFKSTKDLNTKTKLMEDIESNIDCLNRLCNNYFGVNKDKKNNSLIKKRGIR